MTISRRDLLTWLALIVVLSVVLISCDPPDDVENIHVKVPEPVKTTSKVEQFPLPNCGGTDKLAQSLGTYASVTKSTTFSDKAIATGGVEFPLPKNVRLKLEIQVGHSYDQAFESATSRLDSIGMSAAPGTHVVYTVVWEEQSFSSVVQYSSNGKDYEVPYTYTLSVPKIDGSDNVACPTPTPPQPALAATATSVPPDPITPDPCYPPSNLGLVHLSDSTDPMWSVGIWASENILSFIPSDQSIGTIDTNDPDFDVFQIWISPCNTELHAYSDGARFWPLKIGVQPTAPPIRLGQLVTVTLPRNRGLWTLGNQLKP